MPKLAALSLLISSVCFTFASFIVRTLSEQGLTTATLSWGRFFIGFILLLSYFLVTGRSFRIRNPSLVFGRAVTNVVAVWFFYETIRRLGAVSGNVWNMTYLFFVGLLGPITLKEKTTPRKWLAITGGFLASALILFPSTEAFFLSSEGVGHLVGLGAGLTAAFTVLILRGARASDSVETVVFYLMAVGSLGLLPFVQWQELGGLGLGSSLPLWFLASALGVCGQLLFTYAYGHVSAVSGSVLSSTRILFAFLIDSVVLAGVFEPRQLMGVVLMMACIAIVVRPEK